MRRPRPHKEIVVGLQGPKFHNSGTAKHHQAMDKTHQVRHHNGKRIDDKFKTHAIILRPRSTTPRNPGTLTTLRSRKQDYMATRVPARIEGKILLDEEYTPLANCENDIALMNAINHTLYTAKEMQSINNTRMYFQAYWINDIMDTHTLSVHPFYTFERNSVAPSTSKIIWPPTRKPTLSDEKLWRRACDTMTTEIRRHCNTKSKPFNWYPPHQRQRTWKTNIIRHNEEYRIEHDGHQYSAIVKRTTIHEVEQITPIQANTSIPLTTSLTPKSWKYSTFKTATTSHLQTSTRYCSIAMTEGSVVHGSASYGLAIANDTYSTSYTTANGRVWANPGTAKSYREEAGGVANLLLHHQILPKILSCDNEAVVRKLNKSESLPPLKPEWDLLEPARKIIYTNKSTCIHTKGHQDKENRELTML